MKKDNKEWASLVLKKNVVVKLRTERIISVGIPNNTVILPTETTSSTC